MWNTYEISTSFPFLGSVRAFHIEITRLQGRCHKQTYTHTHTESTHTIMIAMGYDFIERNIERRINSSFVSLVVNMEWLPAGHVMVSPLLKTITTK